jgi:hypothetical protein
MTPVPTRATTTATPAPGLTPGAPPSARSDAPVAPRARPSKKRDIRSDGMTLVLHWGGPRHGEVDELPAESLASSTLVYDGPRWFGVYEQFRPVRTQPTPQGQAEVWVVRE